ncbi:MAG: hypothetical protein Q8N03_16565 [Ignavibacteria bacterium]|jgi:hypothetical protein|nr:hypothetical protein [Ignavibacteria bacterium]MDP3832106.1 hypothetical protein [Ignavibacteriaceae bacterium]
MNKEIVILKESFGSDAFDKPLISWGLSLLIHLLIIFASVIFFRESFSSSTQGDIFLQISSDQTENDVSEKSSPKEIDEKFTSPEETSNIPEEQTPIKEEETKTKLPSFIGEADTSSLRQIYAERTLNVRVRFPVGWTYIDQNRKNKLDGVTFLGLGGSNNSPPIVHLEVKEKYLFNPTRYKYNFKLNDCIAYYNDPEEMLDYVTQIFYLVTENSEDYSLKLTVKGRENFNSQQPVLFAMLKSFKFGSYF